MNVYERADQAYKFLKDTFDGINSLDTWSVKNAWLVGFIKGYSEGHSSEVSIKKPPLSLPKTAAPWDWFAVDNSGVGFLYTLKPNLSTSGVWYANGLDYAQFEPEVFGIDLSNEKSETSLHHFNRLTNEWERV